MVEIVRCEELEHVLHAKAKHVSHVYGHDPSVYMKKLPAKYYKVKSMTADNFIFIYIDEIFPVK